MTLTSDESRAKASAQTVERALSLLECFTVDAPEWTVSALAAQTGLTNSTVYRLLATLEAAGLVERNPTATSSYRLGLQTVVLAHIALIHNRLRQLGLAAMTEMTAATGLLASLGCLYRDKVLYLGRTAPKPDPRAASIAGRLAPIHCTGLGKAILAFLPEKEADRLLRASPLTSFTPTTLTTIEQLKADLQDARQRGFAIDRGEWVHQSWCVAAPIRSNGGQVAGAISLTAPASELNDERLEALGRIVVEHASRISYDLGYTHGYS